ncbi:MAG: 5'/3'-nucleotidase SurE [Candidatus Cloacimonadota bacterium]|nr:MAG: 5'/3'-nucleotidase SurE [Candidatus Cloacimonadota bacterium]
MRILVTNDDGFYAAGIKQLKNALKDDNDVYLVAPDREKSAASHSLTLNFPLRINKKGEKAYTVDGTPTDCVLVAIHGLMKDNLPDLIISGINHGPNMGEDVTYSGTVAAAFEGTILGIKSIAVSLVGKENLTFDAAEIFIKGFVKSLNDFNLQPGTLINVNVPNLPPSKITGIAITKLGKRIYRDDIIKDVDPRGKYYYWIGGDTPIWEKIHGTDFEAIEEGKISITPMHLDLTHYKEIENMRMHIDKLLRRFRNGI